MLSPVHKRFLNGNELAFVKDYLRSKPIMRESELTKFAKDLLSSAATLVPSEKRLVANVILFFIFSSLPRMFSISGVLSDGRSLSILPENHERRVLIYCKFCD